MPTPILLTLPQPFFKKYSAFFTPSEFSKRTILTATLVISVLFLLSACDTGQQEDKKSEQPPGDSTSSTIGLRQLKNPHLYQPSEEGFTLPLSKNDEEANTLRLSSPPKDFWWHNATVYQIWVRSFSDSDGDGNGDLQGIINRLPYIASLGVDAIWLSPIFDSPSHHGYDTRDYYKIQAAYGDMNTFDRLVAAAKKQGIKIVLDIVINHVSEQHPWFLDSIEKKPPFDNYFVWSDHLPEDFGSAWGHEVDPTRVWHTKEQRKGWFYGVFGYGTPDLNYRNAEVRQAMKDVATFWLNRGVEGFRLDAVRYLYEEGGLEGQRDTKETVAYLSEFSAHIRSIKEDALIVGEAFTEAGTSKTYHDNGEGMSSVFDFDFSFQIKELLSNQALEDRQYETENKDEQPSYDTGTYSKTYWQNIKRRREFATPSYFFSAFLTNHDLDRLSLDTKGDQTLAKIAATLLLTSPSTGYIYYGQEIHMNQADNTGDFYRRAPMQWNSSEMAGFNTSGKLWLDNGEWFPWLENFSPWWSTYWEQEKQQHAHSVESQINKEDSILNYYRKLITLKKNDPVFSQPEKISVYHGTDSVLIFTLRNTQGERWVMINLNPDAEAGFTLPNLLNGRFLDVLSGEVLEWQYEASFSPGEIRIVTPLGNTQE